MREKWSKTTSKLPRLSELPYLALPQAEPSAAGRLHYKVAEHAGAVLNREAKTFRFGLGPDDPVNQAQINK